MTFFLEKFTDDYDMGADLVKMHGSTPAFALYSLAASDERAFNALALNAINRPVPLGYKNAQLGEWLFTFDDEDYGDDDIRPGYEPNDPFFTPVGDIPWPLMALLCTLLAAITTLRIRRKQVQQTNV